MEPFLLGPDSVSWRVNRERAMLLGGGCALLLQIAHPLIAAGVAGHSDFERDPLGRLRRTLAPSLALVFGSPREAENAAARIRAVHDRVRGRLRTSVGRYVAGTPYDATDPELLAWVQATLIETSIRTFETFVEPLSRDDRRRYYDETRAVSRLLGITDDARPPTYDAFVEYWRAMISSDEIAIGDEARRLAVLVLRPRIGRMPRRLWAGPGLVTAGLLPERVRTLYGLRWTPAHRAAFRSSAAATRAALGALPARVRLFAKAREAEARARADRPPRTVG